MKKVFAFCVSVLVLFVIVGCGAKEITVSIPKGQALLFPFDEYNLAEGQDGFLSRTENEDGSLTYVLSAEQQKAVLSTIAGKADEGMKEMVGAKGTPNVTEVTADKDYTAFTIKTTSTEASFAEKLSEAGLVLIGNYYNLFKGNTEPAIRIQIVNADTGDVLDEYDSGKGDADKSTQSDTETVASSVKVTDCRVGKDNQGRKVAIVDISFTNDADNARVFFSNYDCRAYDMQDGTELQNALYVDGVDNDAFQEIVNPGDTLSLSEAFILKDATKIKIEITNLLGTKTYFTNDYSIS